MTLFPDQQIILATTSRYRKEAFGFLGIDFSSQPSDVDETFADRPTNPQSLVLELSKRKAQAVADRCTRGIVVGFDSVGWFNGMILEKPKDRREAQDRIKMLSGSTHFFYTGVTVIDVATDKLISDVAQTEIKLRTISDEDINFYLDQDPNFNTYAIGYDPLSHYSASFAQSISGSYNNYLRGIPLETILILIQRVSS